jgi:2-polyprenyl-3-methyl-5-hydroxy-6-metoxy-1,4-benzoquinol methylase
MNDLIYHNGQHYDLLLPDHGNDLPFWLRWAERCGGPILELGCGTGRLTIPIAKRSFDMTGIDFTAAMLNEARTKSNAAHAQISWVEGDMRSFDLGQQFNMIFLPANTLCHLLTNADFEACIKCVQNHLSKNGRFIVDVFVPNLSLLLASSARREFSRYLDPNGMGEIVVTSLNQYAADTQINHVQTFYKLPGQLDEIAGELNMRMYFPQELDALLCYNGFAIEAKFGTYNEARFGPQSEKQLVVWRKQ